MKITIPLKALLEGYAETHKLLLPNELEAELVDLANIPDTLEIEHKLPPAPDSQALMESLAAIGKAIERGDPQEIADKWLSLGVPALAAVNVGEAA